MNNNFENRLRESLSEQSNSIEIEGAGASAAATRALARGHHMNAARGLASLVIVAGLGALAYRQFSGGSDNLISTELTATTTTTPDNSDNPDSTGPRVSAADLASSVVPGTDSYAGRFLTDDGQLIQVTTSPGVKWEDLGEGETVPYVVQVSDKNGLVATNELPAGISPSSFAYHDGVLYSVSTSPATVNDGLDVIVNTTSDNGSSWSSRTIVMPAIPNPEINSAWRNHSVAASDAGVLVSIQTSYFMDFTKVLPQYSYENGNFDIRQTETGVDVRDWTEYSRLSEEQSLRCQAIIDNVTDPSDELIAEMERCWADMEQLAEPDVIATFTWAELGVEPISPQTETLMYFTAGDEDFEKVSAPPGNGSPYVVASNNGFIAEIYSEGDYVEDAEYYEPRYFASGDGRSWTEVQSPPGTCGIRGSQSNLFITQDCETQSGGFVSADLGRSWLPLGPVPTAAPEGYASYVTLYAGDLGYVAFRNTEPDYALLEEELARADKQNLSPEEMERIERDFSENADRRFDVLFSSDGQSWETIELGLEVEGPDRWGNDALIGKNEIVLTIGSSDPVTGYTVQNIFLTATS